jgi:hypothetical protein
MPELLATIVTISFLFFTLALAQQQGSSPSPADIERRVESLLGRMTIEEKVDIIGKHRIARQTHTDLSGSIGQMSTITSGLSTKVMNPTNGRIWRRIRFPGDQAACANSQVGKGGLPPLKIRSQSTMN